jgi:zinc D-Ala-D-Ala carboxypeptidase|tara:strand:- start:245 stop:772 length:528 start_codon:yes stop_codon:yes gene_type:complete
MRITKNFSLQELVYSPTALHAGIDQEEHLDNNAVARLTTLTIEVLQKIRDQFGPTKVNSCFRSRPLNDLVHGSPNSQHCCFGDHTGAAADIEIVSEDVSNMELAEWIRDNLDFDQLILENYKPDRVSKITGKPEGPNSGWVHVSYSAVGENRKEVLRMVKNPKTKKAEYFPGLAD